MCGIIGYLGDKQATPILMESLKRLEYRGYDSAGVAVMETDIHSTLTKSERKVDDLIAKLSQNMPKGTLGIGHTRWATHGRPTIVNAHPHSDCYARIMVVHNGIIENFKELKEELEEKGHEFTSETDSEVIPHLVEDLYQGDLLSAVRQALQKIKGAYAMALYSHDDPELLIGARLNAPLVVGMGEGEWFIASDITAIIPYTKRVLILGEGEIVAISPVGPQVTTLDGVAVEPRVISVDWDVTQAQKGGFDHFMRKEIHETPEAAANVLRGRIQDNGEVTFNEFTATEEQLGRIRNVKLLGMGTSLHAAMIGEYVIEDWAGIPSKAEDASEFRYRRPMVAEGHPGRGRHPVGRDRRHHHGHAAGARPGRADGGHHQRRREHGGPRRPRGDLPPGRPRDRGRIDQDLCQPRDQPLPPRDPPRRVAQPAFAGAARGPGGRAARPA